MKHALSAVVALSLLNGPAVMAQPNRPGQGDNRGQQDRNDQNRNDQGRGRNEGNLDRRDDPGVRAATPRFSRGDRLPDK